MSLLSILVLLVVVAGLVHVTRFWPRVAFVFILIGGGLLVWNILGASSSSLDIVGVTLALEPGTRDFLTVGFALTALLALAATFPRERTGLGFLFWSWPMWVAAMMVSDFVVAVFAWTLGLVIAVLAMRPRKYQRASGAAYFLVLVVIATACLLLANRLIVLYPLTPERTDLIQFAVLLLAWGLGLLLAIFPFHLWVGPMADDTPLPVLVALLGFGQPIGLWLLIRLLGQYSWVIDKSNLFDLVTLGGTAAILVGGFMAGVERRAGRLLGYAAIFSMGFVLVNLGRVSRDALSYAAWEILARGLALTVMACAIVIGRQVENQRVRQTAILAFLLAGLSLVGLRLGVGLYGRWNLLIDWAGGDLRVLALLLIAHTGLLVGVIRFARHWLETGEPVIQVEEDETALAVETAQEVTRAAAHAAWPVHAARSGVEGGLGGAEIFEGLADQGQTVAATKSAVLISEHGENSNGSNGSEPHAEGDGAEKSEEYVFEEHVREIARAISARLGPHLRRLARSVPRQTEGAFLLVWQTWRVWTGMILLVGLIVLLVLVGLAPEIWYERLSSAFGQPPFIQ